MFIAGCSLIIYSLGGCNHIGGAAHAWTSEYNDVYTDFDDDEKEKDK